MINGDRSIINTKCGNFYSSSFVPRYYKCMHGTYIEQCTFVGAKVEAYVRQSGIDECR